MQSHQLPDRPWSRVAANQFKLHGKEYLVLVEFYSDFIEVKQLQENTSSSVVEFLKEQFSRYGIPDTLVTDNCPQFTSLEFQQFSRDWEFVQVSSSPHHHRSNGKVESAVKVAKSLLKKALKDNKDPWLAMLDQRNTPTESLAASPAQRLMCHRARTRLPTATSLLYPKVPESVPEKLKLKRHKVKWYHDRSTRTLPELEIGQEVWVVPLQKNETWKQGTCLEKLSDRSYLVKPEGNSQAVCWNWEFLKPSEKPAVPTSDWVSHKPVSEPVPVEESQPLSNGTQSVFPEEKQTIAKTRTRVVELPSRFKDYVT